MKIKINKEKTVMAIAIGISCFALMLVMFMQFKVVRQTNITEIETMRESELRAELTSWQEKYKEINERYQEITNTISQYQNESESDQQTAQLLEKELEQLNLALGKTDVEGQGIIIALTDNEGKQIDDRLVDRIYPEDLLLVVNALFGAGAEAISINDQRIIAMSDISSIGDVFLRVNSERISSPYIIKAIGDITYLQSAILGKGGCIDQLKEAGHDATVTEGRRIEIEKYNKTIRTDHID